MDSHVEEKYKSGQATDYGVLNVDSAVGKVASQPLDRTRPVKTFVIVVAIMAAFGGLLFGYDIGGSGGTLVMPSFRKHFGWPPAVCCPAGPVPTSDLDYCMRFGCAETEVDCIANGTVYNGKVLTQCVEDAWEYNPAWVSDQQGWISFLFTIGCFCGALTSGTQTDYLGRKKTLMLNDIIFIVGVLMQIFPPTMGVMYAGRFIGGVAIGTLSMAVTMYQSEMAPEHVRGVLVTLQQLCITFGILLAAAANVGLKHWTPGWRLSYGGNIFFAIIMVCAMFLLPESPRWLVQKGLYDEARTCLQRVRHSDEVEAELANITACVEADAAIGEGSWADTFSSRNNMRYRTMVGALLQFFQQLTGINAIMFFAPDIFATFFSETGALWANLALTTFNFLATFICIYLVERSGRVTLLVTGGIMQFVGTAGCAMMASPLFDYKTNETVGIFVIVFAVIFVCGFAYSWGPVVWVLCSEIFPQNLRGKGMSVSTATNWAMAAVVGKVTPYLYRPSVFNLWGTFVFFSCFIATMTLFVYTCVPETAGVALEDTDTLFDEFKVGFERKPTSVNRKKE